MADYIECGVSFSSSTLKPSTKKIYRTYYLDITKLTLSDVAITIILQ